MPNLSYKRGYSRERKIKGELEKEGYVLVVRTAGSHSPVDVIGLKEFFIDPQYGLCAVVKLVQSKTSTSFKEVKKTQESLETVNGPLFFERWEFPVNVNSLKHTKQMETRRVPARKVKTVYARRCGRGPKNEGKSSRTLHRR